MPEGPHIVGYQAAGAADPSKTALPSPGFVEATKWAVSLAVICCAGYLLLLLGWTDELWFEILNAVGWIGLLVSIIGNIRLRPDPPYRSGSLNAGIILLWTRFWWELVSFISCIPDAWGWRRHPLTALRKFDWMSGAVAAALLTATAMVVKLHLRLRKCTGEESGVVPSRFAKGE